MWNDILLNLQVIKGHADFTGKILDFHQVSLMLTTPLKKNTPASTTGDCLELEHAYYLT